MKLILLQMIIITIGLTIAALSTYAMVSLPILVFVCYWLLPKTVLDFIILYTNNKIIIPHQNSNYAKKTITFYIIIHHNCNIQLQLL